MHTRWDNFEWVNITFIFCIFAQVVSSSNHRAYTSIVYHNKAFFWSSFSFNEELSAIIAHFDFFMYFSYTAYEIGRSDFVDS